MTARSTLAILVLAAACATACIVVAPRASANDPASDGARPVPGSPRDPVAALTAEETAAIRQRLPEWDRIEPEKRARIAGMVLRLRTMSADDRASFLEKMRRLGRAGPDASDALARNVDELRSKPRDHWKPALRLKMIARAVALAIRAELPADLQAAVFGDAGPREPMPIDWAIASSWRRHAVDEMTAAPPLDGELPATRSPEFATWLAKMRDELRALGAAAPEKRRREFAQRMFEARLLAADTAAPTEGRDRRANEEHLAAIGRRLRAAFPAAFDAVLAEVKSVAAQGTKAIDDYVAKSRPPEPQPPEGLRTMALWRLLAEFERIRPMLPARAREKWDDAEGETLRLLRVPEERIGELKAAELAGRRFALLKSMEKEFGVLGGGPGRIFPGGRRGPGGGGKDDHDKPSGPPPDEGKKPGEGMK